MPNLGFKWMSRSLPGEEGFWGKALEERTSMLQGDSTRSLGTLKVKAGVEVSQRSS